MQLKSHQLDEHPEEMMRNFIVRSGGRPAGSSVPPKAPIHPASTSRSFYFRSNKSGGNSSCMRQLT